MDIFNRAHCKICNTSHLIKFISLGEMPVANAFLKKEDLEKPEYKYELAVGFCENCKMVQLMNIVPYEKYIVPDASGKTNYAFFSSTSKFMEQHFASIAYEIEEKFLDYNSRVLDIGSNDGIFLKAFKNHKVLGIEPSQNVAEVAQKLGIETITKFFSEDLAKMIVQDRGRFRAVFSSNVILNIIELHELIEGVKILLDEKGVFIFEDPYIPEILEKTSYDQIYDEHIWYFSLTSLSNLFLMHGMEIFDAEKSEVHGGSMRVYTCASGKREKTQRLFEYLEEEKKKNIHNLEPYLEFAKKAEKSKQELFSLLKNLKSQGKKIAGYAAASKGTIVLNYCNIGQETLDYISDSTPYKQGLFSPGKHIPIVSPDYFHNDNADYALLGAWNHAKEIMEKEQDFIKRGGKFIVHYPEARILGEDDEVQAKKLNVFSNEQGYLFETLRADDKIFEGKFGQALVSVVYPNIIKGMHLHKNQTDYTCCIKGNLKYVAIKETQNGIKTSAFTIGEKNPMLIKCPPNIWHGYTPVANQEAVVLHIMDKPYNPEDDDTERKDAYAFGDVWSVKNI